jgi:hypothetical protein
MSIDVIFDKWSKADKYITTDDRIKYVRLDYYVKLEEGATKLAHKYEELLNIISAIKSDVDEIDTQKETDAFSDLTQAHDIPY